MALFALITLKLLLVAAQPVVAHANASFDDRLFLALAEQILKGHWLGPYSQFTLMKGPMYSLFIAGAYLARIPLPIAQHLLYLSGCALLVAALRPCLSANWQATVLFILLWWQPMSYVELDVVRQNIYTPLTLLVFAGLCALETRRRARVRIRVLWGVLLGVSAGAFYLTREEGIWIVPGAGLLIAAAFWNSWRAGPGIRPLLVPLGTAMTCAAAVVSTVCALNYHYYNWFGTVEFRAAEFLSAYGALQRPIPSTEIGYVPVTREVREKLYPLSPAFAELESSLEGTIGQEWANLCRDLTGRPGEEREIAGGWFMWAMRDAVVESGHAHTAREALDFYKQIATEVNRACDEGRAGAARRRSDSMMPPWRPEFTDRLLKTWRSYLKYFFMFCDFSAFPTESWGSADLLALFRDITHSPLAPSAGAPELRIAQSRLIQWRLASLEVVGRGARWICVILTLSGLIAWLYAATGVIWGGTNVYLFLVATAALGSALAVATVNMLVHVLSFPNQNPTVLHEGYPLLVLSGMTAWIAIFNHARHGVHTLHDNSIVDHH